MPPDHRHLLRARLLAALALTALAALRGADQGATMLSPFRVEAEFGVDGARLQPSGAVLNPLQLEQHGIRQLQDLSGAAPNLFLSHSDTRGFGDILVLRGVANSIFFSSPGVALYIDDVPAGSVSAYPSSLLHIASLVVKAGPQGTDYGRNAPGGVIEIRTREPGNRHQGQIQVDYGSYNASSAQASFEGPLSATTGYSVGLGLSDRDGYLTNTFLRRSADDRRAVSGRAGLFWRPDAATRVHLAFRHERSNDDATRLTSLFSPDRRATAANLNGETKIARTQFSGQFRRQLAWGTLTATSARQTWKLDPSLTDLDLSPLALGSSEVVQQETRWTHEVRAESNAPAGQGRWRAGIFYSDQDTDGDAQRQFLVPPSQYVPPGFIQTERTTFLLGQRTRAAYAGWDQPLAARTLLKLGLRLEHDATTIDRSKVSSNNFRFPAPPEPRLARSQDGAALSGTAGLQHSLSPNLNLVARTALAGKPQGYSGFTANPALARFARERQWAQEAGLTFGDPRARLGGSLLGYWTVIKDYQFERTVPNSTDYVVVNAPEVLSRGIEAKAMWSPVDRVWWDVQVGYALTTFEDHRDATGARLLDKQVPFVPRYTLRTGLAVDLGRGWSVDASYAATGRTSYDERNTATFQQPAYGLVNAQVRYRVQGWAIAVYGHNLTDRRYDQFINPEIFAGSPGAPRRYGVRLTYEY